MPSSRPGASKTRNLTIPVHHTPMHHQRLLAQNRNPNAEPLSTSRKLQASLCPESVLKFYKRPHTCHSNAGRVNPRTLKTSAF
ncbi:hypothetical protein RRG08_042598 [Elysia crispata]|uniref:Uncharacterized protein n=1 Tax=Elysia crispata TaxID=231223 RepID=A0AAE1CJZ5_9GAST|nr:hypothetical protein RRG08_042598 [Elysia crispata]